MSKLIDYNLNLNIEQDVNGVVKFAIIQDLDLDAEILLEGETNDIDDAVDACLEFLREHLSVQNS